jgi:hypothetical protein
MEATVQYGITETNIKLPYSVFNRLPHMWPVITVGCAGWQCLSHTSGDMTIRYG